MSAVTARGRALWGEIRDYLQPDDDGALICSRIARHAVTHHRLAEAACNGDLSPTDQRLEQYIEGRITELALALRVKKARKPVAVKFTGDPRGPTVRLMFGVGNTWDGNSEGWGVAR